MKNTSTAVFAFPTLPNVALLLAAFLGTTGPASASTVTWNAPQNISGDADVSTNGTLVGAFNLGPSGVSSTTVNGVTFSGLAITGNTVAAGNFQLVGSGLGSTSGAYVAGPFGLSASYQSLISSMAWQFGQPLSLTLSGLTPGATYQFQWWSSDNAGSPSNTSATAGNTVTLASTIGATGPTTWALGQFATGYFVADGSAAQLITFSNAYYSEINGFQLRQVSAVPDGGSTLGLLALAAVALRLFRSRSAGTRSLSV